MGSDPEAKIDLQETEAENIELQVLKVDEEWRPTYRSSLVYNQELRQEIFDPPQEWNLWEETKEYWIKVSGSKNIVLTFYRLVLPNEAFYRP